MLRFAAIGLAVCICLDPFFLGATYAFRFLPGTPPDVADELFRNSLVLFGGLGILGLITLLALAWMLRVAKEDVIA